MKDRISAVYERKKRRIQAQETILNYLDSDDVDGALDYISKLTRKLRNQRKIIQLKKLAGYVERNRHGIWYKKAREKGISIGAGSVDKAGDILICRRMKLRGMQRFDRKLLGLGPPFSRGR